MSSLDAIYIDDGFDERDNAQTSYKPFHYVDENSQFKNGFVDVSMLPQGIYFLNIISEKQSFIRKFVKN